MPSASTPPPASPGFDIISTYNRLLATDPDLTMPIAAIESLVEALSHSRATTISETLSVLQTATSTLKTSVRNPISLSAGTDLFTRYLVSTLRNAGTADADFAATRAHLLANGRVFVRRAKDGRALIAAFGKLLVRDGCCVLCCGGSRVVSALLREAAGGGVRFRVIYVLDGVGKGKKGGEGAATVALLRRLGVPVATIGAAAVAHSMGLVDMVIVGAEGVVENGGVISRLGTYQLGLLAKSAGKPFYVVAESHKFVRLYPLGQMDLGIEQKVVDFRVEDTEKKGEGEVGGEVDSEGAVDFTPPDLISALITESGVLTPSAVSEELIKIWF